MTEQNPKNLEEIRALPKEMLIPKDVCGYLGCKMYAINCQAQHDPEKLGFPVTIMGTRVRIPKAGFIAWAEGRKETDEKAL